MVYRAELLEKSHMDGVDFFVNEYQKDSLDSIAEKAKNRSRHFIILDASGEVLLGQEMLQRSQIDKHLQQAQTSLFQGKNSLVQGELMGEDVLYQFVATRYPPWGWTVYLLQADDYTLAQVGQIFRKTFLGIAITMLLVVVAILLVLKRFIFNRITTLKRAAALIATKERLEQIDIHTPDDFGDLARSMESMAEELYLHEQKQQHLLRESSALNSELLFANAKLSQFQSDMDLQVKERTDALEKIQSDLHRNLHEMETELKSTKEKNHRLVRKLSELTLKQSDMVNTHSEVVRNLRVKHDTLIRARNNLTSKSRKLEG
jgi:methyl-accepting chemotaxis protein